MEPIVSSAFRMLKDKASQTGLELVNDVSPETPKVRGERHALRGGAAEDPSRARGRAAAPDHDALLPPDSSAGDRLVERARGDESITSGRIGW